MTDTMPLTGRRIIVTRPVRQADSLVARLEELGADVVKAPAIVIEPPASWADLDATLARINTYDWMVFTSVNGVEAFYERAGAMPNTLYAAIGPATAEALAERGARADVVPDRFIAEALFDALSSRTELRGKKILLPRADIARQVLPKLLRSAGADVDVVTAYRTLPAREAIASATQLVRDGAIDAVTFTSGSTVRAFFDGADDALRAGARAASIGPITSAALRAVPIEPAVEAERYTTEGLVEAIGHHFAEAAD